MASSAWEDQQIRDYVPSSYSVCSRGIPEPVEPSHVLTLLPEQARDLLGAGLMMTERSESERDCSQVTTEEARALAGIFDATGFVRDEPLSPAGEVWLRYLVQDLEAPRNQIFITFEPVLPHGEATFLGPG